MDRRTFVGGVSTGVTIGLAGCVDDLDLSSDGGAESDDTAESDRSSEAAAEAATEDFLQALADGDGERQDELLHEDATGVSTSSEARDLTINEIEYRTVREIVEQQDQSASLSEIQDAEARINEYVDEIGADDSAHVYFDVETEQGSDEGLLLLVENDGEWLIYAEGFGPIQTQAEATGEETQQQVSDRLQIQSATGTVTDNETIGEISLTVTKAPGADDIDLPSVSYQFFTDSTVVDGTLEEANLDYITRETDDFVITDRADRYMLIFSTDELFETPVEGEDRVAVTLTTPQGATTMEELRVPDDLDDRDDVEL